MNKAVIILAILFCVFTSALSQSSGDIVEVASFKYGNGLTNVHAGALDTVNHDTPDTTDIAFGTTSGSFDLKKITVSLKVNDADESGTPDSLRVRYEIGNQGIFVPWISATTYTHIADYTLIAENPISRTFVVTTDGNDAVESNAGTGIISGGDAIRVILDQASDDGDSTSYEIKAIKHYSK